MEANVQNFLKKAADVVGEYHRGWFYEEYRCQFNDDHVVDSPIEQLFYCAIHALRKINDIPLGDGGTAGLYVEPQISINKYKVDFEVSYHELIRGRDKFDFENKHKYILYSATSIESKRVIVECDSQIFHERTEPERRYEKKRDRDLIRLGYKVFHFTGKEINDNPYLPAKEVLEYLCESDIEMP